ncbi:alpha/beta hydrolase [Nonomuraea glycinis]|uniref:alpha/beta fold hydrolase n=1 Tax=Nonomuraea glycinis TaxID=2047744 RepID=UPI001CD97D1D|nr:alpha/beta hydrolase [Nonomuraea glycinis]MCA2181687.1 alpha/beta hydrolase [Nonomuraea glycinis]
MTGTAISADGTPIVFDRHGSGPALVLVHGAFTGRGHPTLTGVATGLAPWFTVFDYDRRGRGASGDTAPYAMEREIEDLAAVMAAAGGAAMVFGGSSGGALALEAAARLPEVVKLAVWEPPYHVTPDAPDLPDDSPYASGLSGDCAGDFGAPGGFGARLARLVREGRRGAAVELFMVAAAQVPAELVADMRASPSWAELEALAHTLAYEAAVMGPGSALPSRRLAAIDRPALVLNGELSPAWMAAAGRAVAAALPRAAHRVLEGQAHGVAAGALVPELLEFFVTG